MSEGFLAWPALLKAKYASLYHDEPSKKGSAVLIPGLQDTLLLFWPHLCKVDKPRLYKAQRYTFDHSSKLPHFLVKLMYHVLKVLLWAAL